MTGFDFFKSRVNDISESLARYEKLIGFRLPMYYMKFISSFELGKDCFVGKYCHDDGAGRAAIGELHYIIEDKNLDFFCNWFFTLEALIEEWADIETMDEFIDHGLIRIATIGIGGGLFLGIREDNADKIFAVGWDWPESPIYMADDIFEAVKHIRLVSKPVYFEQLGIDDHSQLIRKWGDDYWTKADSPT